MPAPNPDDYRKGVGIMLLNERGEVFVGQRYDSTAEAWQMPQGGIDEGEDPQTTLFREMLEEIGTDKAEIIAENDGWLFYDLPTELQKRFWGGKYLGQMQKWFLLKFAGTDDDINIHTEDAEFKDWKWVKPQELPAIIVPFKQELYKNLLEEFADYLS